LARTRKGLAGVCVGSGVTGRPQESYPINRKRGINEGPRSRRKEFKAEGKYE